MLDAGTCGEVKVTLFLASFLKASFMGVGPATFHSVLHSFLGIAPAYF